MKIPVLRKFLFCMTLRNGAINIGLGRMLIGAGSIIALIITTLVVEVYEKFTILVIILLISLGIYGAGSVACGSLLLLGSLRYDMKRVLDFLIIDAFLTPVQMTGWLIQIKLLTDEELWLTVLFIVATCGCLVYGSYQWIAVYSFYVGVKQRALPVEPKVAEEDMSMHLSSE